MMHRNATNAARHPSLIDTIGTGFNTLRRVWWVLLVPVAINLWLWLGPRLSARPLLDRWRSLDPATWDQMARQFDAAMPDRQAIDLRVAGYGLSQALMWQPISLLVLPADAATPNTPATWYLGSLGTLVGAVVVLNLVATLLTGLYLLPLADAVRGRGFDGWPRRYLRCYLSLLGMLLVAVVAGVVVGGPLLGVGVLAALFVPGLGPVLVAVVMALFFWLWFSASFAYDAVMLDGVGPFTALSRSFSLVRRSFWSAIGLFLLTLLIVRGLGIIWTMLADSIPGVVVAILTSAYIGAGLATARLVFYRDRAPHRLASGQDHG